MKKILLAIVLMSVITSVFACANNDKHHDDDRKSKRVEFSKLELTETQKAQIKVLRENNLKEMKALHDKHQADMKAILTDEQWEKFQEMKPRMRDDMRRLHKEEE